MAEEAELVDGIEDVHDEYGKFEPKWLRCRRCVDGGDAIKAATTDYFPALAGEPVGASSGTNDNPLVGQYQKRLGLTAVYDAADATLNALVGALFRTPSVPTVPDAAKLHLDNIDLAGTSYAAFRYQAGQEDVEVGRYGVLVDWSAEQRRPFWRPYETEDIDNWVYGIRDGKKVLVQVKLRERVTERSATGFGGQTVMRYRVVELNAAGQVQVTVYTKRSRADEQGKATTVWQKDGPNVLTRQGVALTEIPFVCFGRLDLDLCPQKPPLLGICDLQLDHYRLDGDVKWAIHQGCMGGLFVIGDGNPDEAKAYYMGGTANRLAGGATVQYVTLPPDMVTLAKEEKAEDERRIGLMGARMLLAPKREAETAEAAMIHRDGEAASLGTISQALTNALTQCWRFHAAWMGLATDGVGDELSRDFFPHRLTAEEIGAYLDAFERGAMSFDTLLENLHAGQITRDPETERDRIRTEPPRAKPGDGGDLGGEDEDAPAAAEA